MFYRLLTSANHYPHKVIKNGVLWTFNTPNNYPKKSKSFTGRKTPSFIRVQNRKPSLMFYNKQTISCKTIIEKNDSKLPRKDF